VPGTPLDTPSKGLGVQGYKVQYKGFKGPRFQGSNWGAKGPRLQGSIMPHARVQGPKGPKEIGSKLQGENRGIYVPHVWVFLEGGDGAFPPMA